MECQIPWASCFRIPCRHVNQDTYCAFVFRKTYQQSLPLSTTGYYYEPGKINDVTIENTTHLAAQNTTEVILSWTAVGAQLDRGRGSYIATWLSMLFVTRSWRLRLVNSSKLYHNYLKHACSSARLFRNSFEGGRESVRGPWIAKMKKNNKTILFHRIQENTGSCALRVLLVVEWIR